MDSNFLIALAAMNKLNSWVRTSGVQRPRKAVYWLKSRYVIRDVIMAGMLTRIRLVCSTVKCNRCRDGVYFDWNGHNRGHCHTCNGTSKVTLKFVETTIDCEPVIASIPSTDQTPIPWFDQLPSKMVWHHPLDYSSWLGWPMNDLEAVPITDWTPGKEGVNMPIEEAARFLNIVEGYWTQWMKEQPWVTGYEEWDNHRYYIFNYGWDLVLRDGKIADVEARTGPGVMCELCGAPAELRCGESRPPGMCLHHPVCSQCSNLPDVFGVLKSKPLPELGPELTTWYHRHLQMFNHVWLANQRSWEHE